MYLSRIQLNPQRRRARWLLASPQRLHAEVLNAFPDPPTGVGSDDRPRILWRVDHEHRHTYLYVASPAEPDLSKLSEEAGWVTAPGLTKPYTPMLERVHPGSAWGFRLVANPVRYEKDESAARGKRHAHTTVGFQEEWLATRAEGAGFAVEDAGDRSFSLTERKVLRFTRGASKRPVTISTARFDGVLRVIDPERFRKTLTQGLGPAKAYGCGLLTIARP